jgi:ADP-heptose:LPS heptosyltransferase
MVSTSAPKTNQKTSQEIDQKIKVLLIRFSSFGDVLQTLSVPTRLKDLGPKGNVEIHWATRREFVELTETHPDVHKVWPLDRKMGFSGLLRLARALSREHFTHIYDAHNNLRSLVLCFLLRWFFPLVSLRIKRPLLLRKSQRRWKRFLLFRLRLNTFQQPFSGQRDLLEILTKWGLSQEPPKAPQLFLPKTDVYTKIPWLLENPSFIALAPSSAHALKRWPLDYWKSLVLSLPQTQFVCLGGPEDHFIAEIAELAPHRIFNLAGQLSLVESAQVVSLSQILVTNDTGLLHVAEQLGKPAIALMGPAPFGFPSRPSTIVLEKKLSCRPCSKHGQGPCTNPIFHECMRSILPADVRQVLKTRFKIENY